MPTTAFFTMRWGKRMELDESEEAAADVLAAIIHDPRDEVHVLIVGGVPAGFVELDRAC